MKTFSLALLIAVMFAVSGLRAQNAGAASQGNAEKGKKIYIQEGCYSCHGYDGHGGVAPKLAPRPIPSVAFFAIVRHPPPSAMPTFSAKIISDAELTDIWTYLKSIPDPPPVKSIPELNP